MRGTKNSDVIRALLAINKNNHVISEWAKSSNSILPIASSIISTNPCRALVLPRSKSCEMRNHCSTRPLRFVTGDESERWSCFPCDRLDLCSGKKVCLRKSNQRLFTRVSKKAMRVRNPPKRESDELLTKHTARMSACWITLRCPTQLRRGTKIRRAGFKWVLHIRNHYDLFFFVWYPSVTWNKQCRSFFGCQWPPLFFFVILSCMTSSLCLFNLQSRLLCFIAVLSLTRGQNGNI